MLITQAIKYSIKCWNLGILDTRLIASYVITIDSLNLRSKSIVSYVTIWLLLWPHNIHVVYRVTCCILFCLYNACYGSACYYCFPLPRGYDHFGLTNASVNDSVNNCFNYDYRIWELSCTISLNLILVMLIHHKALEIN